MSEISTYVEDVIMIELFCPSSRLLYQIYSPLFLLIVIQSCVSCDDRWHETKVEWIPHHVFGLHGGGGGFFWLGYRLDIWGQVKMGDHGSD